LAIRYDAFIRTGGFVMTRRADFDQQSLGKWLHYCSHGDLIHFAEPTYVFRWMETECGHSQFKMRFAEDEMWYTNNCKLF
jgi:hypothetical protein